MKNRKWEIIGAPFDHGSSHKGSGKAPEAIRAAGLTRRLDYLNSEGFDVIDASDIVPELSGVSSVKPSGLNELIAYAPAFMEKLDASLNGGFIPLILGGDHSISIPSVSAAADHLRRAGSANGTLGLIWVDAHPDLETPGDDSTNDLNAMSAAHLLDHGVEELRNLRGFSPKISPEKMIYIGLRDVVPEERRLIQDMSIAAYTASDIERLGFASICERSFAQMNEKTDAFVLSFDIDAIDPMEAPGVDYPQPGGLTFREAMLLMEHTNQSEKLALFELVEVNPAKDRDETTSKVAVRLLHQLICGRVV